MSEPKAEDLVDCRVRIDAIDIELLQLLNRRTEIVEEIGRIKETLAIGIYEPKREEQVFANVLSHNQGPLPPEAVKRIFERIIDEMRTVQKMNRKNMLVVMQEGATEPQTESVIARLVAMGFTVHRSTGVRHTLLGGVGPQDDFDPAELEMLDGVKECHRIVSPYKLASRSFKPEGTVIKIGDVEIGGNKVVFMGGPCSVESEEQMETTAAIVAAAGARIIRGGAFKPRSSPYSFQGMGEEGLQIMRRAADRHKLLVISEVMDQSQISLLLQYSDILQVGARNMQNFNLIRELGHTRKPILLKRGIAATIEELLLSAEYIMSGGNYEVMLCERGIRTFETATRNTMDISAIPVLKKLTHLPVIADPSHGTGKRDYVLAMARASIAAGADGLLVEVHPNPERAASDGAQTLRPEQFSEMLRQCRAIAAVLDRTA